ncbi:hypothetical protein ASPZODRAFT_127128 [Penicilliopsis zonata CBS 506.65]|uniref:Uncharacterized protein n=1 Tax=Penicilliopsis zonata CBS 506.65 TaxID=1073090 RepID=A0A1L9SVH2_9EURO|nr:hypothetical protein ASPZODRAFT_127128 [Penicilliopsis zonata CBS 506.65]OJJ51114.1 hypothetical protein ASPZODRAFT_127128 [Penicilliopsis zonata CBS 506.65]
MKPQFLSLLARCCFIAGIALQGSHACRFRRPKYPSKPVQPVQPECDCYVVSGPEPGYFQNYQFWDFRAVSFDQKLANEESGLLPARADQGDDAIGGSADGFKGKTILLSETPFAEDWKIQKWKRNPSDLAPVHMVHSNDNVFIARNPSPGRDNPNSTYLVLRTTRFENFTSTAEIESRLQNVFRASIRVHFKILSDDEPSSILPSERGNVLTATSQRNIRPSSNQAVPKASSPPGGVCAGIFTYHSSKCESDIEILTSDPHSRVHYANQPDYDPVTDTMIPGASTIMDVPVPWTSWATHRLDWTQTTSRWFVDEQLQDTKTYRVPEKPSMVVLNLWSDGGSWSGDMVHGTSVHMAIEWIELAYNVSTQKDHIPDDRQTLPPKHAGRGSIFHAVGLRRDGQEESPAENSSVAKGKMCRNPCKIDGLGKRGGPRGAAFKS